jgi:hypothetical protein
MVHGVLPLSAMRALELLEWAVMLAECAAVSGPGYYAAGQQSDVQDVSPKLQSSRTSSSYRAWATDSLQVADLRNLGY